MVQNCQTVISLIYAFWNSLLSIFLHESDILDGLWKVPEKNQNKINNFVFARPPFWSRAIFSVFLTLPYIKCIHIISSQIISIIMTRYALICKPQWAHFSWGEVKLLLMVGVHNTFTIMVSKVLNVYSTRM